VKPADRTDYLAHTVPKKWRSGAAKAFAGKASPRAAIRVKCLDCSGFEVAEVTNCTVTLCPLWAYRPYQTAARTLPTARASELADGTPAPGGAA